VSRIFLSHSSADNAAAVALRDWLVAEGWNDLFLDLDPQRGLKAGERWQAALKAAAERCQLVVTLISPAWAASKWCLAEFLLAKSLNKRILGVLVEPTPLADLPTELTAEWQRADLTAGARDYQVAVTLPPLQEKVAVAFATHGLDRVRTSLRQAGLDARFFAWPPDHDPSRSPYRGLRPLGLKTPAFSSAAKRRS
jgi:TIR domain